MGRRRIERWLAGGALAAAAMTAPGPTMAQDGANLNLVCRGIDAVPIVLPSNPWSANYAMSTGVVVQGRQPAQLEVAVEAGKVRVKPPESSIPFFARDDQRGWYELTEVAIDRLSINGRLQWNRVTRSKLAIDRRTGAVNFGSFQGVCQVASTAPDTTRF